MERLADFDGRKYTNWRAGQCGCELNRSASVPFRAALREMIRNVTCYPRAITACRKFSKNEVCSARLLGGTIFAVDEEGKFREPR